VTVTEFRFVILDDPIIAILSLGGIVALIAGLVVTRRTEHVVVGRRLAVGGAVAIGAAAAYALVSAWLTSVVPT